VEFQIPLFDDIVIPEGQLSVWEIFILVVIEVLLLYLISGHLQDLSGVFQLAANTDTQTAVC